ncbi:MAG: response regulator transcription factor [Ardenticatenaceae bacterium]
MAKKILIVDDDMLMRRSLAFHLQQEGYQTHSAGSAEDGLEAAAHDAPDLVLLDIGLPNMDGLEAMRHFGSLGVPVIFLTARRREFDEVLGLQLGADDYITKPFKADILLARVKSVLRRTQGRKKEAPNATKRLEVGDLLIDLSAHIVTVAGQPIQLAPRTFKVLVALAQEAGKVLSIDELLNRVWGTEYVGEPQVIYVHVRWLREKIEENPKRPRRLLTVRGFGYKLVAVEGANANAT